MFVASRWRVRWQWSLRRCLSLVALCVSLSLAGCGDNSAENAQTRRVELQQLLAERAQPAQVVATVDGRAIGLQSLASRVKDNGDGRSREELLDDLILAQALFERALDEGYGDNPEVQHHFKRLMVKRLLKERVEQAAAPEDIPEQEVRAYYKEKEVLYYSPEMRGAFHLLVKPNSERWDTRKDEVPAKVFTMAREHAARIREDITAQGEVIDKPGDFEVVAERWKDKTPPELELLIERLPLFPRREFGEPGKAGYLGTMVEPFADAVFAMSKGQLSDIVTTEFGAHIVKLKVIQPEERVPFEEADPGIRAFLAEGKRKVLVRLMLNELMKGAKVGVNDQLLERL